jgi:hypothetical protein
VLPNLRGALTGACGMSGGVAARTSCTSALRVGLADPDRMEEGTRRTVRPSARVVIAGAGKGGRLCRASLAAAGCGPANSAMPAEGEETREAALREIAEEALDAVFITDAGWRTSRVGDATFTPCSARVAPSRSRATVST